MTKMIKTVIFWGLYLTLTMIAFEHFNVTPKLVGGVIGWFGVEAVRAYVGFMISKKILK